MVCELLPSADEFKRFARGYSRPVVGWPQVILLAAGIYNILFALWAIFFPSHYFDLNSLPLQNQSLWQCIGMIVGLYGLAYMIASTDIVRYWPIVLIGLLGKVFGPLGYVYNLFIGETAVAGLVVIFFNDLIWLIPFTIILLKVNNFNWRKKVGIKTIESDEILSEYENLIERNKKEKLLLVFLRHFGCTFCQKALSTLMSEYQEIISRGIIPVIIHMGRKEKFDEYFKQHDKAEISHIEDCDQLLYTFFDLKRGGLLDVFSPTVTISGLKILKNERLGIGLLQGDGFQLAGCFLLDAGNIVKTKRNHDATNEYSYLEFICEDKSEDIHNTSPAVTLYYDQACPICGREIAFLKTLTTPGKVDYVDISSDSFSAEAHGKDYETLMNEIHAKDQNGNWLIGMNAFRAVYRFTPYSYLLEMTKLPVLKQFFDLCYVLFARNRLWLTGEKSNTCTIADK